MILYDSWLCFISSICDKACMQVLLDCTKGQLNMMDHNSSIITMDIQMTIKRMVKGMLH